VSDTLHFLHAEGMDGTNLTLDHVFLDVKEKDVRPPGWFQLWDPICRVQGVLGLAHTTHQSQLHSPSVFQNLVERDVLEKNLVALRLAEPGSLSLGRVPARPSIEGGESYDVKYLPLTDNQGPCDVYGGGADAIKCAWQTNTGPEGSITIGNSSDSGDLSFLLVNKTVVLTSEVFVSMIPEDILHPILEYLGFSPQEVILCEQRGQMPNITIAMGGHDFVVTPWEYTVEWPVDWGEGPVCMSAFWDSTQSRDMIVLGSAFMRGFMTILDWDEKKIGCK
jgi:hypothetical protein